MKSSRSTLSVAEGRLDRSHKLLDWQLSNEGENSALTYSCVNYWRTLCENGLLRQAASEHRNGRIKRERHEQCSQGVSRHLGGSSSHYKLKYLAPSFVILYFKFEFFDLAFIQILGFITRKIKPYPQYYTARQAGRLSPKIHPDRADSLPNFFAQSRSERKIPPGRADSREISLTLNG